MGNSIQSSQIGSVSFEGQVVTAVDVQQLAVDLNQLDGSSSLASKGEVQAVGQALDEEVTARTQACAKLEGLEPVMIVGVDEDGHEHMFSALMKEITEEA